MSVASQAARRVATSSRVIVTLSRREWEALRPLGYRAARQAALLSVNAKCPDEWPVVPPRGDRAGVHLAVLVARRELSTVADEDGVVSGIRTRMLAAVGETPDDDVRRRGAKRRAASAEAVAAREAKALAAVLARCAPLPASDSRWPTGKSAADLRESTLFEGRFYLPTAAPPSSPAPRPQIGARFAAEVLEGVPTDDWVDVWAVAMRIAEGKYSPNSVRVALRQHLNMGLVEARWQRAKVKNQRATRLYRRLP